MQNPATPEIVRSGCARRTIGGVPATIWVLVFPEFQLLDATGPAQVFSTANDEAVDAGRLPSYRIRMASREGGAVISSAGVSVMTEPLPGVRALRGTTVVVSGGRGVDQAARDTTTIRWLVRAHAASRRCCSVCSGAFLLARAGLLKGRRAVTHWQDVELLRRQYPEIQVHDDAIYLKDGKLYTSAGITAGIDLCLSLVQEDLGRAAALGTAKRLVVYHKRPGGQRQFSSALLAQSNEGGVADRLTEWLRPRLNQQIGVEHMAATVDMSVRSLHRRLQQEAGITPAGLLTRLRLEAACALLESAAPSIKQVARKSGFGSEYNLRRAFAAHLGVLPRDYLARFG
jgi:transcriptional regulator GlxA family with amidase domain